MDDHELVRRVLAGDEIAAATFFDEFFPRLYRFACVRLGGDDQGAEEVVQATLTRGVRKLHTWRGEAALFTWLCTLCRREIGDWLERTGRTRTMEVSEDDPGVQAALDAAARLTSSNPEIEAGRSELARLVQVILDQLPRRYGEALEWRYGEGLPVSEIARRLDVSYKAAESLLSRARPAFRAAFAVVTGAWPGDGRRRQNPEAS